MFKRVLAAALSLCVTSAAFAADLDTLKKAPEVVPAKEPSFFLFSDTQISYRYQFPTVSPGVQIQRADGSFVSREAPKQILNISHADAWAYGTNFFSLDILKSGSQFPAGTTNPPDRSPTRSSPITATPKPTACIAAPSASTPCPAPRPSPSPASSRTSLWPSASTPTRRTTPSARRSATWSAA